MGIKVDLTSVETLSFEPLPKGTYTVRVDDFKESRTKSTAKNPNMPIVSWKLVVEGGDYDGRTIWDNMPIIPPSDKGKGTLWRVKAFLEAMGYETSENELDLEPGDIVGERLRVRLSVTAGDTDPETGEEYDKRNEVKAFLPLND